MEIVELQRAVGARLAKLVGAEAATWSLQRLGGVCSFQATAGCIRWNGSGKIYRQLPETDWDEKMKSSSPAAVPGIAALP